MENLDTKYLNLIYKKLSGTITPSEQEDLDQWLAQSPENRKVYEAQKQVFSLTGSVDDRVFAIDVDKEWDKFQKNLRPHRVINFMNIARPVMAIAAMLVLFFAVWIALGTRHTYIARQDRQQVVLPDKSVVTLRKGSRLVVLRGFGKASRDVKLKGEAYFVVTHDDMRPFRVKADGFMVQVVGTEFLVSQKHRQVVVNKGVVKVATVHDQQILKAGQGARIEKQKIIHTNVVDKNAFAWATGEFYFDNTPLSEVFDILQRTYNVKIIVQNPAAGSLRLTATFKNKNLDFVLNVIAQTEDLHIYKTAPKVYVVK